MEKSIVSFAAIIGLVAIVLVLIMQKPELNVPTISVSGTSELTVSPDKAELYLTILTEGTTADVTQANNSKLSDAVIAALQSAGIAKKDIETSNYYLAKRQEWDNKEEKMVDKGYMLTHTLKVTTIDIENVGKYVDTAITAGANGVERIEFGLTKETEKTVKANALALATVAAKEKAASIAKTAGVTLGKITSITESNFYYTPYSVNAGGNYAKDMMAESIIPPQKVDVTTSITLAYELK
ncbi:MAG: SIMPL domain-containing protein [archaeon]